MRSMECQSASGWKCDLDAFCVSAIKRRFEFPIVIVTRLQVPTQYKSLHGRPVGGPMYGLMAQL